MKKFFTLLAMMVMLSFSSQAAYYLVGQSPFGNGWNPADGVEMTPNADGTYSYKATINGAIWFVMADGLAEANDWATFNDNLRIGPTGGDVTVEPGAWMDTQKSGGDHGAYEFTGTGEEYEIIFDPAKMQFKVDGYVAPIPIDFYTVCGSPVSVFGTEWDPTNTDNDMVELADGTFELKKFGCELAEGTNLEFKIAANHNWDLSWPNDNVVLPVNQSGSYDITFTFKPETTDLGVQMSMSGSIEVITGDLFILGEVNGNTWDPSDGVKMETEDNNIFTSTITTAGENIDDNDGIGYSYFSFTTKLGENSDDWSGIAAYRIGATEDGYLLTPDLFGMELPMSNFGQTYSFRIAAGTYHVTVNLEAKTLVI